VRASPAGIGAKNRLCKIPANSKLDWLRVSRYDLVGPARRVRRLRKGLKMPYFTGAIASASLSRTDRAGGQRQRQAWRKRDGSGARLRALRIDLVRLRLPLRSPLRPKKGQRSRDRRPFVVRSQSYFLCADAFLPAGRARITSTSTIMPGCASPATCTAERAGRFG
jgi:hypothetical protein